MSLVSSLPASRSSANLAIVSRTRSPVAVEINVRTGPLLQVDHLNAWYGRAQILFDVDIEVGLAWKPRPPN